MKKKYEIEMPEGITVRIPPNGVPVLNQFSGEPIGKFKDGVLDAPQYVHFALDGEHLAFLAASVRIDESGHTGELVSLAICPTTQKPRS